MSEPNVRPLPADLVAAIKRTYDIVQEYLSIVGFIIHDSSRDPTFYENHLLSYLGQDFIQSAISIVFLAREGALSVAKRELRFIIESSIKMCYIQQKSYSSSVQDKLKIFEKELASPSISVKRDLSLHMLPEDMRLVFDEEIGRLYGLTSRYVHLTPDQLLERIAAVNAGRTVGYENAAEIDELNRLLSRGFSGSLVLVFHGAAEYVAGDWLVNFNGSTSASYFMGSRFMAGMDSFFDYKHERQQQLTAIQAARASRIQF